MIFGIIFWESVKKKHRDIVVDGEKWAWRFREREMIMNNIKNFKCGKIKK